METVLTYIEPAEYKPFSYVKENSKGNMTYEEIRSVLKGLVELKNNAENEGLLYKEVNLLSEEIVKWKRLERWVHRHPAGYNKQYIGSLPKKVINMIINNQR